MNNNVIRIDGTIKKKLCDLAVRTYPAECCAMLFTRNGEAIDEFCELSNKCDRNNRYITDPHEIYECEKTYLEKGYEVMGFFHSHPDSTATVSNEDERNMIPGLLYLIAQVTGDECRRMRLWRKNIIGEA